MPKDFDNWVFPMQYLTFFYNAPHTTHLPCFIRPVTATDGFHGDETLLTSYEIPFFFVLAMSAKLIIFNTMKSYMRFH